MSRRARSVTLSGLLGVAGAGTLAGHALSYLVLAPGGRHRHELLAATGHGYLHAAGQVALCWFAIAIAIALVAGARRWHKAAPALGSTTARLAAIQVSAFVAVETMERIVAGAPLGGLYGRLVALGVLVQVLVAFACGALLVALDRTGSRLAKAFAAPRLVPASDRGRIALSRDLRCAKQHRFAPRPIRGPPVPLTV